MNHQNQITSPAVGFEGVHRILEVGRSRRFRLMYTHIITTTYCGLGYRYVLSFHRRPQYFFSNHNKPGCTIFRRSPCDYSNCQYRIPFSFLSTNKVVLDKMVLKQIMYKAWFPGVERKETKANAALQTLLM